MLNKTSNFVATLLITLIITAGVSFAQEDSSKSHMNHDHKMDMKKDDHKHMDHNEMMGSDHKEMMDESKSIIQEGTIDLATIDENGDGKVYQDQMCWNVISDKAGDCPQCGMKLKEVSLEKAKANLEKNDFKVK
jgi:hypothetical protein